MSLLWMFLSFHLVRDTEMIINPNIRLMPIWVNISEDRYENCDVFYMPDDKELDFDL